MTTVILGLGSSLGNRLKNLRLALQFIRRIPDCNVRQISPVYLSDALLPDNAPPEWDSPYLNLALRCDVTLSPTNLLRELKACEIKAGRLPEKKWGPRFIDIDLLAYGDHIQYDTDLHVPHEHLLSRPFALWPLADVAPGWRYPLPGPNFGKSADALSEHWGSRFTGEAPFHTHQIAQRIDTPELVGILNLTPDSFSDGGQLNDDAAVLNQAEKLCREGATVLDIGAEATNPTAAPLTAATEWQRLQSVLPALLTARKQFAVAPAISIDTRHISTAEKALALGVDWINDVSGLDDPEMRTLIAKEGSRVVIMHHLGIPANNTINLPEDQDPVQAVLAWGKARLQMAMDAGIAPEQIIFDPGIGFGKTALQSITLLKNTGYFNALGVPLLIGHSRKRFFSRLSSAAATDRDPETAALSLMLARQNVAFLRVHNVGIHTRQWQIQASFPTADSV